jgi:hypothetical protein
MAEEVLEGAVKSNSALREVGKSFRRTRVSSRWWGGGFSVTFVAGEEMAMDHASPFRKRVLAAETDAVEEDAVVSGPRMLRWASAMRWLD